MVGKQKDACPPYASLEVPKLEFGNQPNMNAARFTVIQDGKAETEKTG